MLLGITFCKKDMLGKVRKVMQPIKKGMSHLFVVSALGKMLFPRY